MSRLNHYFVGFSLLLGFSNLAFATSPDATLKFKNPADQALYEQGEKLREKQEACMQKPGSRCTFSVHDFEVLKKSENLIQAMNWGQGRLSGIIGYEALETQWHPERDAKTLQDDQNALLNYKSKHPVITAVSHISDLVKDLTKIPDLQRKIDEASNQSTLSKLSLNDLQTGIQHFHADIDSYGLVIVTGKTSSGNAQ